MKRTTFVCSGLVLVSAVAASVTPACGPSTPQPVAPPPSASASVAKAPAPEPLKVAPRVCNGRKLIGTIISQQADQEKKSETSDKKDDKGAAAAPAAAEEKGSGSFQKAYQAVAPATVVIKAKTGFGSGVAIDKTGLILTNYHVVQHGMQTDFTIKVTLNFGHKSATGGMEIDDKTYEGFVVKADRVRDLALIRVKDAPKDVKFAPVSKNDPTPGQPVSAVGHAGIGMLWAMKSCHVSAVGEPARNSFITARDCGATAELGITDPDELKRVKEQCEKSKVEARNAISEFREGLFVQSDCRVAPGDSGGPLVNEKGEIVGLNQSVSADSRTAAGTSYHVHAAELREFAANVPAEAVQVTPDPWCDGGSETELQDIDLDGEVDGVMATSMEGRSLFGPQRFALLLDLDEDHGHHDQSAEVARGESNMPYDAELALLSLPVGTFVWYDSNNDGFFDVLLSDPEDKGKPQAVFDIDKNGKLTERKGFSAPYFFDTKFLPPDEKMHTHLGKFATIINPRLTCPEALADATAEIPVPDPIRAIGQKGRLGDLDGNGKPDTIVFSGAFTKGASIDADEDAIGNMKPVDDPSALMKAQKVDPELSYFMLPSSAWAVYDRDNDGKADLALLTSNQSTDRIATQAFVRSGNGAWTSSKDFLGQKVMRPALIGIPRAMSIARSIFNFSATDEGLGTLPDPMPLRGSYDFGSFRKKPEDKKPTTDKGVLQGRRGDYFVRLFDADKDTKIGAKDTAANLVSEKKFDVDVAMLTDDHTVWVFYDTDQDKKFDLVLIGLKPSTGIADRALRLVDGRLQPDTALAGGKLYLHKGIFKDAKVGTGFKKLATDFLPARAIQE